MGELRVERAYYYCKPCGAGHSPRDAALRLDDSRLSPGATRLTTLAGTISSFAEAASKALPEMSGMRVGESTVQRTAERVGARLGKKLAEGHVFGPSKLWAWTKDAEGKSCAYIAADSTGVGMQGPNGAATEGRMAAVAMVWNGEKEGEVRYVSGMTGGLAALGEPLRKQGGQVGMDGVDRWVAISDGGAGIEEWFRSNFPRVEAVILDFYHASEYLHAWIQACHSGDDGSLVTTWCHRLKHEGGRAILDALRAFDANALGEAARERHRETLVYFENQSHRMEYPTYRAKGWPIGSGPVEAACKQVVNARLKGTGMRWGEPGADAICHLRALFRSEKSQWDAFWVALAA